MVLHSETGLPVQHPGSFTDYVPASRAFSFQVPLLELAILEWVALPSNELILSSELVETFGALGTRHPRWLQA